MQKENDIFILGKLYRICICSSIRKQMWKMKCLGKIFLGKIRTSCLVYMWLPESMLSWSWSSELCGPMCWVLHLYHVDPMTPMAWLVQWPWQWSPNGWLQRNMAKRKNVMVKVWLAWFFGLYNSQANKNDKHLHGYGASEFTW